MRDLINKQLSILQEEGTIMVLSHLLRRGLKIYRMDFKKGFLNAVGISFIVSPF